MTFRLGRQTSQVSIGPKFELVEDEVGRTNQFTSDDGIAVIPQFKADDDRNRRARKEENVDMTTVLQPAQMLQSEIELHEAARTNDVARIKKLVMQDRVDVNVKNNADDDRNRRARKEENVDMTTVLQPAQMLQSEIELHEAARTNDVARIKKLVMQDRVDVNVKNNLDRTALHWAAACGHVQVIELLIRVKADVEARDKYGMRALLWAAWFGHNEAIRALITEGADEFCANKQGLNVLHCAAHENHVETVKFIFEAVDNMNVNGVDQNERSALHLASEKGNIEVCEILLANEVDLHLKDNNGQTAVHLAAASGKPDVLSKLLLHGTEIDDTDALGRTSLHLACENGHINCADVLLRNNADFNAETKRDATPLMSAASNGHADCVVALLDYGCNVNVQNSQGNTAVHLAGLSCHNAVLIQLVDAYAELDISNQRQQTPLHACVEAGLADSVEILLVAGASIEAHDKHGKTALQLASRGSYIGIVDMIIKADRFIKEHQEEFERMSQEMQSHLQFKRSQQHQAAGYMQEILWKLATKQLKSGEWKKLARHWKFTEPQLKAIEHQYTGTNSYKEHGYRVMMIWLHGIPKEEPPIKHLFESLCAIGKKELAEHIRRKANVQMDKSGTGRYCVIS